MKFKSVLLLAVAIGCGLVAMLGVQQVLSNRKSGREETAKVLVALVDISPGTPLTDVNVSFKEISKSAIPQGAVTAPEQFEERALRSSAVTGEFIMLAKLSEKGQYTASSSIPEGMAVATVPVNNTKTHSGLLQPGDRVDILVTYQENMGGRKTTKTETVLQYVEVFATDSVREAGGEGSEISAKNVSFLVTPEHAAVLMTAEREGGLSLLLRPKTPGLKATAPESPFNVDTAVVASEGQTEGEDVRDFLNEEGTAAGAPAGPTKPMWKMTIYTSGDPKVQEFEMPEEELQAEGVTPGTNSKWIIDFMQRFLTGA